MTEKEERRVKRAAKKQLKKLPTGLLIGLALCLVVGMAAGALAFSLLLRGDGMTLNGDAKIELAVGEEFTYRDEGVCAKAFGRDISDRVEIQTNLIQNEDGSYTVDTSVPGEYYILYRTESMRFGGVFQRVRLITVGGE